MPNKTTIKDIAEAAGVSIGSVHMALNDKSGVSEATRERIKRCAEDLNYKPNILASNLRRETRSLAVILPPRDSVSRLYYDYMWQAIEDFEPLAVDYNLKISSFSCDESGNVPGLDISRFSGIVAVGNTEYINAASFEEIEEADIPLILVDTDVPESGRLCCVYADTRMAGNATAELLLNSMHRLDGNILVFGAGPSRVNRQQTEDALCSMLKESGLESRTLLMDFDSADDNCISKLVDTLKKNVISGACAVNSRSTLALAEAIQKADRVGFFPVIGNGLFPESREHLENGTLTALVHKNPYEQCYRALSILTDMLVKDIAPSSDVEPVQIDIVLRSLVGQYA